MSMLKYLASCYRDATPGPHIQIDWGRPSLTLDSRPLAKA